MNNNHVHQLSVHISSSLLTNACMRGLFSPGWTLFAISVIDVDHFVASYVDSRIRSC